MTPPWPEHRLRHLAVINPSVAVAELGADDEVTFVPLECVWPGGRVDVSRRRLVRDVVSGYTRFLEGDVLVPKITPTFQARRATVVPPLWEGRPGFGTTELHILRPLGGADARFLAYRTLANDFIELGAAAMVGVAGQQRVPATFLKNFRVALPKLDIQREIADELDDEMARAYSVLAKCERLAKLVTERTTSMISQSFESRPADWRTTRLKYLLKAPLCYGVLKPDAVTTGAQGVPLVRVFNISADGVDRSSLLNVAEDQAREFRRVLLQRGDAAVSVVGTIGKSFVVDKETEGCLLPRAIARVQPLPTVPAEFLHIWFRSASFARQAALATGNDTAQATLNMGDLSRFEVFLPQTADGMHDFCSKMLSVLTEERAELGRLRQVRALTLERRDAVVTKLVTGGAAPTREPSGAVAGAAA